MNATGPNRPSPAHAAPPRVVVLGSTGSIGVNTLAVIEHLTRTGQRPMRVVGLAAGANARTLADQARRLGPEAVALARPDPAVPMPPGVDTLHGDDAAQQLVERLHPDLVVSAIVGAAGLPATLAAIRQGATVALANKETLVAAGDLVMPLAQQHGAALLPIDSEHSAVFQCIVGSGQWGLGSGARTQAMAGFPPHCLPPTAHCPSIRRIVLTASGGPFRDAPKQQIDLATPEQALNHPTWDMGPKISIDSATMMNKALEIIEAHHLFGLPPEKIDVIIHPQSVVHSFVEFVDHSILAQMGPPDMRTAIQVALTWPDRTTGCSDQIDWTKLTQLNFQPPDGERFPALRLAYDVIRAGGTAGAVFNAANEAAVAAFLERRIRFGRIVELVSEALAALPPRALTTLEDATEADRQARAFVQEQISQTATT